MDTSLLYALFNAADAQHAAARKAFEDPEPIGLPAGIVQETLDLVRFRQGKAAAVRAADDLRSLPNVRFLPAPPTDQVEDIWRRHEPLSHADAGAIATALREKCDLLTADVRQRAAHRHETR